MMAHRSTLLYPALLAFLLQASGVMAQDAPAAPAQAGPTSPAEVAREFVARVVKHDYPGAPTLPSKPELTEASLPRTGHQPPREPPEPFDAGPGTTPRPVSFLLDKLNIN